MTGEEISRIIEKSATANVRVLELPGIRLEFGEGTPASVPTAAPKPSQPTRPTEPALSAEEHARQTERKLEEDELALREEETALLLIENPFEFERRLLDGDLLDVAEGDEDGSTA